MNKKWIVKLICSFVLLSFPMLGMSCSSSNEDPQGHDGEDNGQVVNVPSADKPTDMALIYLGNKDRPKWTASDMRPHVYREKDGKVEWLFDGYLFMEIYRSVSGANKDFGFALTSNGTTPATKNDWTWLLDETFSAGRGPLAVEEVLVDLIKRKEIPKHKRIAQFAIPNPQKPTSENGGNYFWGSINHKIMDFSKQADRLEAIKWYIDEVLRKWEEAGLNYVDLGGFYWLHETIDPDDYNLVVETSKYLKAKNLDLVWIPYNGAERVSEWRELGFTTVYQQPNYFFLENPLALLTNAIEYAKEHGIDMEFEFDGRVTDQASPVFKKRFKEYVTEYQNHGIWDNKRVAYYMGTAGWLDISKSEDPQVKELYKMLADIIVERNGKLSKIVSSK